MRLILYGDPRTKKNSQRIARVGSYYRVLPSKQYVAYAKLCAMQIKEAPEIHWPVNIKCVYYMKTRRKVDLVNLIEGTLDILVGCGVLLDDNSSIVAGHDGSCVKYDKENPRVEIEIEEVKGNG